ncbi:dihydrodipicolinate synthase family protein [Aeoliella sp.]|uniref:dihydrodipicolinate synthase family protein n=1 Tax=Aeoliella sp. TaxID=2795800 RepID=UPI003CCBF690
MNNRLTGLYAATFTPMRSDGSLDLQQVPAMVSHLAKSGVAGIYVGGSTGEGMSLTSNERMELTEAFIASAKDKMLVIAHVGHNSLAEARLLAQHAWNAGADVISATAPSYYKIGSVRLLLESMAELASAVPDAPFYYYHIPSLTGNEVSIPRFLEQAPTRIPSLAGIKYTAPYVHEYQAATTTCDGKYDVLWGTDEMLLSALVVGAQGAIGSTYNISAPLNNSILTAFTDGDLATATGLQQKSVDLIRVLLSYPFHAAMKSLLARQGIECGPCRLPLGNLSEAEEKLLHQTLDESGISNWLFDQQPPATINKPHVSFGSSRSTTGVKK